MRLDEYGFCAVELYASAVCNLNCVYCFQPKVSDHMKKVNEEIVEWVTSGKCEDDLLEFCPTVQYISLWGGEPTINLPLFTERLENYWQKFPKLKEFNFSTNISTRKLAQNVIDFLRKVQELNERYERNVQTKVQFSIDGLPELNDTSRLGSKALEIMENIEFVLSSVPNFRYGRCHFKATHNSDALRFLSEDDNLERNFRFFEDYYKRWKKISPVFFPTGGEHITLVAPGGYISEDGKYLTKIIKKLNSEEFRNKFDRGLMDFSCQVMKRIKDAFSALSRNYSRTYSGELILSSTCSACKTQFALDHKRNFHVCHGTYFFDSEMFAYLKKHHLETEYEKVYGYDWSNFNNVGKDKLVCSLDDELNLLRLIHACREHCYDVSPRIQFYNMILLEMASCGQVPVEFASDDRLRDLAVAFLVFGTNECVLNNVWEHGSYDVDNIARLRLIFNGPFQECLRYLKEKK